MFGLHLSSKAEFKLQKQFSICASGQVGFLGEVSWIQLPEACTGTYLRRVSLDSGGRIDTLQSGVAGFVSGHSFPWGQGRPDHQGPLQWPLELFCVRSLSTSSDPDFIFFLWKKHKHILDPKYI